MNLHHDPLPPGAVRGAGYWVDQVVRDMQHDAYVQSLRSLKGSGSTEGPNRRVQWLRLPECIACNGST